MRLGSNARQDYDLATIMITAPEMTKKLATFRGCSKHGKFNSLESGPSTARTTAAIARSRRYVATSGRKSAEARSAGVGALP
jgi:hypothetical protein